METMFRLPSISAGALQEVGLLDFGFDPSAMATPQVVVFPVGFSWAPHLCNCAARAVLASDGHEGAMTALGGQAGVVLTDRDSIGVAAYAD